MGEPLRSWGLPKWSKWGHGAEETPGAEGKIHLPIRNRVRLKGKGERGKFSNTSFTPYPLIFSQTTREVHTAYRNRMPPFL